LFYKSKILNYCNILKFNLNKFLSASINFTFILSQILYLIHDFKSICSCKSSLKLEDIISTKPSAVSFNQTKNHLGITQVIIHSKDSQILFE
jgi:hypothetical protein